MDWADPSLRTSRKKGNFVDGPLNRLITIDQLKKVFPRATDDKLLSVAGELNVNPIKCGLESCFQKAHFFAQIREECGVAMEVKSEKFSYSSERLKTVFSYYANREDEAVMDGYLKDGKSADGKKKPSQDA
jgi:predicted chitinase